MLASDQWYNSPLFGIAGFAVGLISILIAIWIWQIGPPRRRLACWMQADTALVAARLSGLPGMPSIEVRLAGHTDPIPDPHVLSVRLENLSRTDIRSGDFAAGQPLVIDTQARILDILNREALKRAWPHLKMDVDGSKILIAPTLITSHKRLRIDLLTDGPAKLTTEARLADVSISQVPGEPGYRRPASDATNLFLLLSIASGFSAGVELAIRHLLGPFTVPVALFQAAGAIVLLLAWLLPYRLGLAVPGPESAEADKGVAKKRP